MYKSLFKSTKLKDNRQSLKSFINRNSEINTESKNNRLARPIIKFSRYANFTSQNLVLTVLVALS